MYFPLNMAFESPAELSPCAKEQDFGRHVRQCSQRIGFDFLAVVPLSAQGCGRRIFLTTSGVVPVC